jgi:hypothetical protein
MWQRRTSAASATPESEDNSHQPALSQTERAELQRLRGEVESLTTERNRLQEEVNSRNAETHPQGTGTPQMGGGALVLGTDERPLIQDDELGERTYEHHSIWMAEFARKVAPSGEAQAIIRDRRFYDCRIYGPVVFGPLAHDEIERVFVNCEWIEEQEAVSWLSAENHEEYVGVVRLEDCRFERCHLSRVGVLKQEEQSPVKRLDAERAENERLREQTDQLRTTAESYVDTFHKRENADHNRLALIHELGQLWEEGQRLPQYDHARYDIEDWEARSSKLIEMALGVQKRRDFVEHNPEYARWSNDVDENDPEELVRMRMLLDRLRDLTRQVNSYAPYTELRSDFDVREYRKWLDIR